MNAGVTIVGKESTCTLAEAKGSDALLGLTTNVQVTLGEVLAFKALLGEVNESRAVDSLAALVFGI